MEDYRRSSQTISNMSAHIVWVTKYRYHVLKGDDQKRCRDLLIQICNSENVKIHSGLALTFKVGVKKPEKFHKLLFCRS
jgi:putative transposase